MRHPLMLLLGALMLPSLSQAFALECTVESYLHDSPVSRTSEPTHCERITNTWLKCEIFRFVHEPGSTSGVFISYTYDDQLGYGSERGKTAYTLTKTTNTQYQFEADLTLSFKKDWSDIGGWPGEDGFRVDREDLSFIREYGSYPPTPENPLQTQWGQCKIIERAAPKI